MRRKILSTGSTFFGRGRHMSKNGRFLGVAKFCRLDIYQNPMTELAHFLPVFSHSWGNDPRRLTNFFDYVVLRKCQKTTFLKFAIFLKIANLIASTAFPVTDIYKHILF